MWGAGGWVWSSLGLRRQCGCSQPSASRSPSAGRRQPARRLWFLLCLEADARDDPPAMFLPGACYCSKARQTLQGEKGWCTVRATSAQGQRRRGWIAFFDNTRQEVGKFNHGGKHPACPGPLAPLLSSPGLGQSPLAVRDALGPDAGSGLCSLFPAFITPGVKINNTKLAWPSRPWKRVDVVSVATQQNPQASCLSPLSGQTGSITSVSGSAPKSFCKHYWEDCSNILLPNQCWLSAFEASIIKNDWGLLQIGGPWEIY